MEFDAIFVIIRALHAVASIEGLTATSITKCTSTSLLIRSICL